MRTYMKNVDPSTSGAKLVIRYFPSLSWSSAATATIARINTLSLCFTYKLCCTFLRSTTGGRYYTLFLLLLIVRLCPFGRNCRAGYSHFHQLTSPISSSLLLNQQGADWCQNWLSCNSNSAGQGKLHHNSAHLAGQCPGPCFGALHLPHLHPFASSSSSPPAAG